ncbi:ribonuclease III [Wenyingzhuangia sp. 2_MG-2023]|uniref:ribonuclease III n=1 Tax=Wenyingzhuangia sp. 2_MG-2023 TaxID=3062639 RepID=UPI0026E26A4F|nr:ribonuclease III [Wenyingzhuangia sp. 2_MG-2023]MDO6736594.1 ribonuclease III [Wenyingzhuangia sp. 2_MG-2023]
MKFFKNIKKSRSKSDEIFYKQIKNVIGFVPKELSFYKNAFTHASLQIKDKEGRSVNYERLEYLGDAMLGSIIAAYLYNQVPDANEGYLTQMRSKIVSREHLNELGKDLDLLSFLSTSTSKSKIGNNIHGNLFEALIGAVYLDRGYGYCVKFIYKKVIGPYVDIEKLEGKITSYKGVLIEWSQKNKRNLVFDVYEDTGNQKVKHFSVKLLVDGKVISKGRATSKKRAEEMAAKRAYYVFQSDIAKL